LYNSWGLCLDVAANSRSSFFPLMDVDRNLQAAILESFTSTRSSNSNSTQKTFRNEGSSSRRLNTMAREGIVPANAGVFPGSKFGRPSTRRHSATDQQRIDENNPDQKKFVNVKRSSYVKDTGGENSTFLPRSQWISLGDGWFQATPTGTGGSSRCGLHSVIESSLGQLYVCLYEPRTQSAVMSCNSETPQYDLSVSAKAIKAKNTPNQQSFEILFAFKSATDYLSLCCSVLEGTWGLNKVSGPDSCLIASTHIPELRPNIFYNILIQVRDGAVSADVDGVAVFTSVRVADSIGLGGMMGLLAKVINQIINIPLINILYSLNKGFKIRH
jgi:hypothetical protein